MIMSESSRKGKEGNHSMNELDFKWSLVEVEVEVGQWTEEECNQFEHHVIKHGWGKWALMSMNTRSNKQIMNHAFSVKKGNQLLYDRLVREHDAATAMVERPELRMTNREQPVLVGEA